MLPVDAEFYLICVIPPGLFLLSLYPWLTRRRAIALEMDLSALVLALAFILQERIIRSACCTMDNTSRPLSITAALTISSGNAIHPSRRKITPPSSKEGAR